MPRTAHDLFHEALQLPETERIHLADLIEASVDESAIEQMWVAEANRRLDAIDRGETKPVPWEEVRRELDLKTRL